MAEAQTAIPPPPHGQRWEHEGAVAVGHDGPRTKRYVTVASDATEPTEVYLDIRLSPSSVRATARMTPGMARTLAAGLIAEADRADRIRAGNAGEGS